MTDTPKVADAQLASAINALTPEGALRTIIAELTEIRQALNESIAHCTAVPRLKALEDLGTAALEGWDEEGSIDLDEDQIILLTDPTISVRQSNRVVLGFDPGGIIGQNMLAMAAAESAVLPSGSAWPSLNVFPGCDSITTEVHERLDNTDHVYMQREGEITLGDLADIAAMRTTDPRVDDVVAATVDKYIKPQDEQ